MKRFILYNNKTNKTDLFEKFSDAEKALVQFCINNVDFASNYFIGKLSHTGERKENHTEIVIIDQESALTGYFPQEGDVFIKTKRFNNVPNPYAVEFERKIIKVNPDTIVVVNRADEDNPQVMPIKQWMKWILGAEFIKKAGEDI